MFSDRLTEALLSICKLRNLSYEAASELVSDREWIEEFSNHYPPMKDDAVPAIRVTCKGSLTVLIIDPQGFKYPR